MASTTTSIVLSFLLLLFISTVQTSSSSFSENDKSFVKKACNSTLYSKDCYKYISPYASKIKSNQLTLCKTSLYVAYKAARSASSAASKLSKTKGLTETEQQVVQDCVENLKDSVYELKQSWDSMSHFDNTTNSEALDDIKTWASAALTDETTCTDEFDEMNINPTAGKKLRQSINKVDKCISMALSFVDHYPNNY
ncbi:hypothetical protein UlMin_026549 [Ulmus minor]